MDLQELICAHSPDSDDAYMFYALATRKIRSKMLLFRHQLEDIQSLNKRAMNGEYALTAISYHAYPYVADKTTSWPPVPPSATATVPSSSRSTP